LSRIWIQMNTAHRWNCS